MSSKAPSKKTGSLDINYLLDEKLNKGKKATLEQAQKLKGGSSKERKDDQREIKRLAKKGATREVEQVSWKKKAGAIGALVFLCGTGLFQFLSAVYSFILGSGIVPLDVQDSAGLKSILFGGDPWLIYCVNEQTSHQPLPKVLEDSASKLWSSIGIKVGTLNCWEKTSSGRSVAQRFKLRSSPPLAFVVANGNKPKTLTLQGSSKYEELERRISPALKLQTYRIDTLKKWSTLCTSRRTCVVVGHRQNAQRDTALSLLRPLQESYRSAKIVTLDTSFWQLKLNEAMSALRPGKEGGGRGADVLCLVRDDVAGNVTYSGTFLQQLTASAATEFLSACEQRASLVPIKGAPRIVARPSKPKKVTPEAMSPTPSPTPSRPSPSRPAPSPRRTNVDHVGSRSQLESEEEELFEAVDEEELAEGAENEREDEDEFEEDEEVEL
mmetsp:Transcript_43103/g.93897  ORF Transcript_43103/g.93897 Transcript_43103/m.93897 type:complete len:438 (+) Transcript_43103:27-1340(+)